MYRAEKFHTENGPTWMIDRDSLTNNAPTSAPQQGVGGVPAAQQDAIQELARAIVRETGLATDSEEAGRRENDKARAELWRTLAFIDTALLAGIAATVAFFGLEKIARESIVLLVVSVASNLSGLTFAIGALVIATMVIGTEAYQDRAHVIRLRRGGGSGGRGCVCVVWGFAATIGP